MFNDLLSAAADSLKLLKQHVSSGLPWTDSCLLGMAQTLQRGIVPQEFLINTCNSRGVEDWINGEITSITIDLVKVLRRCGCRGPDGFTPAGTLILLKSGPGGSKSINTHKTSIKLTIYCNTTSSVNRLAHVPRYLRHTRNYNASYTTVLTSYHTIC